MKKILILLAMVAIFTVSFGVETNIKRVQSTNISRLALNQHYWSESTFGWEQTRTEANQRKLIRAQPPIEMSNSLERKQINKRTELWNDEYKVSYLYVFLEGVGCLGYYTVRGKVSSVNSSITNPEQVLRSHSTPVVVSAPAEDGLI